MVDALFERLGGAQPVADEAAFDVFSALTGTLTTHYSYLATLTSWAARRRPRDPEGEQRTHPHHMVRPGQLRSPRPGPR
ncbi:hypothetical protein STRAU_6139 [Streptomyces aurantiacus JA 4570]|uniref:Uncharacterized protein n=1 Tax=Streptomyces aurantiacus JA 4570 TaxID=1286094 RepID=S3ZQY7_9ACTN|nr:hypothetical protein STRAU_6139 [Streptomyces aurantiacus JA 4570]